MATVIPIDGLVPPHTFRGHDHGDAGVSFLVVNAPPNTGPRLHRHPYAEVFVVQEGEARFTAGDETFGVSGGNIVVVPSGTPHKFINIGTGTLRSLNIHAANRLSTEWLEATDN